MSELDAYYERIQHLKDNFPADFDNTDDYLIEKKELKQSGKSQQTEDYQATLKRFIKLLEITPLFKRFLREKVEAEKSTGKNHFKSSSKDTLLFTRVYEYIAKKHPNLLVEDGEGAQNSGDSGSHRVRFSEKDEDKLLLEDEKEAEERDFEADVQDVSESVESIMMQFTESPIYVNGELRPYQIQGLNWMVDLYHNNLSGILADEMGLGKTLQTVSFLGYLRYFKHKKGPFLIITPKSTLNNWQREFNRWTPDVNCFVLQGDKQERAKLVSERMMTSDFDVVVASYEVVIIEKMNLKKFNWEYIVIDEAHRIKNEESLLSQVIREFKSKNRMLITGTPLQNNLHELWALLNFLLPDIFASSATFDDWFGGTKTENETENGTEKDKSQTSDLVVKQLHGVLTPFLLRRIKQDVEHSLKPKVELSVYTGLSAMQKKWYRQILEKDIDSINGSGESKTQLLNIMMQLRKCCNHPYLFDGAEPGPPFTTDQHLIDNSAKLKVLDQLLMKFKKEGSRVLIFSQMSRVLDILEDYCFFKSYQYCRIDGSTDHEDRIKAIDEYNAPESEKFIFLLTTRAGGLGINLTSADIVVLFDSDWNPQADLQAMDRAHRIGQKKQVKVFRFITEKTVEEKILERAKQKLRLDQLVIQQGRLKESDDSKKSNGKDELLSMIQHGAKELFEKKSDDGSEKDDEFDLEKLLTESEQKTQELNAKYDKLTLDDIQNAKTEAGSTYEWNGKSFKKKPTSYNIIDANELIRQQQLQSRRERQTNYNIDKYYSNALNGRSTTAIKPQKKLKMERPEFLPVYHFYPDGLRELSEKKRMYDAKLHEIKPTVDDCKMTYALYDDDWDDDDKEFIKEQLDKLEQEIKLSEPLTDQEEKRMEDFKGEGLVNWTKLEYRKYITAIQRHGRDAYALICNDLKSGKTLDEVKEYSKVFWENIDKVENHEKIVANIKQEERKIAKLFKQQEILRIKVSSYNDPLKELVIKYPASASLAKRTYSEEQDRFFLTMLLKYGIFDAQAYEKIRLDIRKNPAFYTDFAFINRTAVDIQRRCVTLLQYLENEKYKFADNKKLKKKLLLEDEQFNTQAQKKKKV